MQTTSEVFDRLLGLNHYVETSVSIGTDETGVLINEDGDRILFEIPDVQLIDDGNGNVIARDEDAISFGRTGIGGGVGIKVDEGVGGSGYGENMIMSVQTSASMFSGSTPSIGNAISAEIDLSMFKPTGFIERTARVAPWVRLVGETEASEWIQKGTFYIDTREYEDDGQGNVVMTIHGYDAMLRAEELFPLDCPLFDNEGGTADDVDVVQFIASTMGILTDPRTVELMTKHYQVMRPTDYTMREVLCYIAGMYAGNFVISDAAVKTESGWREQLRFIPLRCIENPTQYLVNGETGDVITFGLLSPSSTEGEVRILV